MYQRTKSGVFFYWFALKTNISGWFAFIFHKMHSNDRLKIIKRISNFSWKNSLTKQAKSCPFLKVYVLVALQDVVRGVEKVVL